MNNGFEVFDSHVHIGSLNGRIIFDGKRLNPFPNAELKGNRELSRYISSHNISKCLVIPFYTFDQSISIFELYNPLIIDCVSKVDNAYGALWITPNSKDERDIEQVMDLATCPKIRALKTTVELWEGDSTPDPASWDASIRKNMNRIIDFSQKHNLPIHFHTSVGRTNPIYFENFFREYGSTVKIHFVHMGMNVTSHFRFIPLFTSWIQRGYPVYCDTSSARGFAVRWLVYEILQLGQGFDRIMFASDEPWGDFPSEYSKIVGLEIDDSVKRDILYNNAQKLYG